MVDFETTGLDLRHDDIVSFGLVLITQGRIDLDSARYGLVKPRKMSSTAAFTIHAVHARDLGNAMSIEQCAEELTRGLSGRVLVAHAAWIELPLINRALRNSGRRFTGPVLDTAAMARAASIIPSTGAHEPSLELLAMQLDLPIHTPHHALGDALTTAQLALALAARLERAAPRAGDLVALAGRHGRLRGDE